jgi:hypothetical protein
VIGRLFAKSKILIDDNAAEKVLADEWQCEDGLS